MLALVFEILRERYAVPAERVVEVLPRPAARAVPGAPEWIDGLFARDEGWVPIVDLARLISGSPCPPGAASRVAVVARVSAGSSRLLGLLAPGMTRVIEWRGDGAPGVHLPGKGFLGKIETSDEHGVQLVEIDLLLPPEIDRLLFGAETRS